MRPGTRHVWVVIGAFVAACGQDFPNEPAGTLTMQLGPGSVDTMTVTDTDTLAVEIADSRGDAITGVEIDWQSSDAAVLELKQLTPASSTLKDSLTSQLKIQAIAHARGEAEVVITVDRPGFKPAELRMTITILERWTSVGAGWNHTCAVAFDGEADCWGSGLLGNGTTAGSTAPAQVAGELRFDSVSASGHTCAIARGTGLAYCWGLNNYGQVGNGTQFDQLIPDQVSLGQTFHSIAVGAQYSCGLAQSGVGYCWGFNRLGQLGDFVPPVLRPVPDPMLPDCDGSGSKCALTPVPVRGLDPQQPIEFLSIDASPNLFTCAIKRDASGVCWGLVPLVTPGSFLSPVPCSGDACFWTVPGNHAFSSVSTGTEHACAIASDKSVYCWGVNLFGELGRGGPGDSVPSLVPGGRQFAQVTAGRRFTCGLTVDLKAVCWGSNSLGQLGNPSSTGEPVEVEGGLEFRTVSAGLDHACGVTLSGAVFCWGSNESGQLGLDPTAVLDSCSGIACSRIPQRVREPAKPGGD